MPKPIPGKKRKIRHPATGKRVTCLVQGLLAGSDHTIVIDIGIERFMLSASEWNRRTLPPFIHLPDDPRKVHFRDWVLKIALSGSPAGKIKSRSLLSLRKSAKAAAKLGFDTEKYAARPDAFLKAELATGAIEVVTA